MLQYMLYLVIFELKTSHIKGIMEMSLLEMTLDWLGNLIQMKRMKLDPVFHHMVLPRSLENWLLPLTHACVVDDFSRYRLQNVSGKVSPGTERHKGDPKLPAYSQAESSSRKLKIQMVRSFGRSQATANETRHLCLAKYIFT